MYRNHYNLDVWTHPIPLIFLVEPTNGTIQAVLQLLLGMSGLPNLRDPPKFRPILQDAILRTGILKSVKTAKLDIIEIDPEVLQLDLEIELSEDLQNASYLMMDSATSDLPSSTPPPMVSIKTVMMTEKEQKDRLLDTERVAEVEEMQREVGKTDPALPTTPSQQATSPNPHRTSKSVKIEPMDEAENDEAQLLRKMQRFFPERVAEITKMQREVMEVMKSSGFDEMDTAGRFSAPHNPKGPAFATCRDPLISIKQEPVAEPVTEEDQETRLLEKMRSCCPARVEEIMRMQRENRERKEAIEVQKVSGCGALARNSGDQEMNKLSGQSLLDPNKEGTMLSRSSRIHSERCDRRPRYAISPPRTQKEVERSRISFRERRRESYHRDRREARGSSQYSRDRSTQTRRNKSFENSSKSSRKITMTSEEQEKRYEKSKKTLLPERQC
ncbi:hypothetical protein L3Y34_019441 [Caenorhabditis briggsae]|uniref:Uncharacterized protein n=1 Tax=Caenorhabditis briggsae TaxID=6238 RepID=A0AAE9DN74_CAEBR|nr:hypothetical protein L3Y34_019441 [Caenorhabditis briggsae]